MGRERIEGEGYVLGHGRLYNPSSERISGEYRFVGLSDDTDSGWQNIMPHDEDDGWLEEQGPGRLVFIPDAHQGDGANG